ncbi:MAG: CDP-diacylglycerol--glycerol-3-phosphate 3-phosphatidyltransferase [Clostridiales Family XIII bacterium]|jgi:CDP-diacylglycerol--glycerol-3-phosphate 3-phosphatidyltransferase|nr:CDP-diacylglycerol--glycerol-3-phosphate 3-phosphatidyltransferase [Clostridiales Family XIII bacterium]
MNLPNKLTMLRMILVPVLIVLLYFDHFYIGAAVFIVASFTDMLDGQIARKRNLITDFGKLMDPLADKLLVISTLVCLVEFGTIPAWTLIIILAREFLVTGLRGVAASKGIVIAAGMSGKIKTVTQMIAIALILLKNWPFSVLGIDVPVDLIIYYISIALTLYSGVEYMIQNRKVFADSM